ncbi:phosphate acyltransferase [Staphylococcus americanisciuri]|uniref:Phosphate acyltransferase n=1 Tax=Staphylococcus americanisciuri TaxID=2973940 RepID=A0ABT2EZ44_9STAP|nr:phosphate acyltransferase [Staphylococcus americanisciuri]MCS4485500.1 phosphate acyltransferase [Staphylococcus americanisciuri]
MSFNQLLAQDMMHQPNIAIVSAHNEATIHVVKRILETTSATFTFYNHQDVTELIRSFDLSPDILTRITLHNFETETDALKHCLEDLDAQVADILMKGHIPTAHLLSAVLKHNRTHGNHFLNHVALCDIPTYHKPLFISDVALNIEPDEKAMQKIIRNIIIFATKLGYQSLKVALLSSTEHVQTKVTSSVKAASVKETFVADNADISVDIDGPLALDNVIDKKSAIQKGIHSSVAGDADAIIVPQLDVGNVLYKSLTYFGHARIASTVLGANYPIILTSRADSLDNKVNSVLLAMKILVK